MGTIGVIGKYASMPFSYGTDCCAFVAECVEAQTGEWLNLDYSTEDEANEIISKYGSLEGAITSRLGEPYFGYSEGYVGLVKTRIQEVAGIFYHNRLICRVKTGLVDLPPYRAAKVWRPWVN